MAARKCGRDTNKSTLSDRFQGTLGRARWISVSYPVVGRQPLASRSLLGRFPDVPVAVLALVALFTAVDEPRVLTGRVIWDKVHDNF